MAFLLPPDICCIAKLCLLFLKNFCPSVRPSVFFVFPKFQFVCLFKSWIPWNDFEVGQLLQTNLHIVEFKRTEIRVQKKKPFDWRWVIIAGGGGGAAPIRSDQIRTTLLLLFSNSKKNDCQVSFFKKNLSWASIFSFFWGWSISSPIPPPPPTLLRPFQLVLKCFRNQQQL